MLRNRLKKFNYLLVCSEKLYVKFNTQLTIQNIFLKFSKIINTPCDLPLAAASVICEFLIGNLLGNNATRIAKTKVTAPMNGGPNHQAPIHLGSFSPKVIGSKGFTYMLKLKRKDIEGNFL